jgi:hypothetical protein
MDNYVNLSTYSALSWRSIISCGLDSEEVIEHWKERMHEVSNR